jgi:serine/threonine protein kinase
VLGYELLTGEGPYDVRSNTDWITAHIHQKPRDLRPLRPDVDGTLADLLQRCLAKDPMHRPRAADVVRVLEGADAGATPVPAAGAAPAVSASNDLAELVKRRVPQVVLLAVGGAITLIGLADALEDLLPPESKLLTVVFSVAAVVASAVVAWFHGERGRQRAPLIEYFLLGLIVVAWLVVSGWILVAG